MNTDVQCGSFFGVRFKYCFDFPRKKTETIQKIQYCGCADSRTRTQTPCKYYAYQIKSNKNYGHQLQGCISQNHPFAFVKKQI